jgi:hypothetical protein
MALEQCPCCDFFTLDARGEYEICVICGWEDDGSDLDRPDTESSPNRMTLREARHTFRQYGARKRAGLPHTPRAEWGNYQRRERVLPKRRRR